MKEESSSSPPSRALEEWDRITDWIDGRPLALVLDYDGTLAPIASRPQEATLPVETSTLLEKLAPHCTLAILSGRDRADVENMVGAKGLVYAGSHGYDISGPHGLSFQHEEAVEATAALKRAEENLRDRISDVKGAAIERKRFGLAAHFREVEDEEEKARIQEAVKSEANRDNRLRTLEGKAVTELQPDIDWDKGRALQWLLDALELDSSETAVIYIGDDTTDEDAFRYLSEGGAGLGIHVGSRDDETLAQYTLEGVDAVRDLLQRLLKGLGDPQRGSQPAGFRATPWKLVYDRWDPDSEPVREALCTLGNGCFATRGAGEESNARGCHYPGTYLAGGYNRLESRIADRVIESEDLVNWPNWLCLTFRPAGGEWFRMESVEVLSFRQELDVREGTLRRTIRLRDSRKRETTLSTVRLVSMDKPHLAAIEWTLTPENWSGSLEILSALDGSVTNSGVERYSDLNGRHIEVLGTDELEEDTLLLLAHTMQSKIRMAQAARTRVYRGSGEPASCRRELEDRGSIVAHRLGVEVRQGKPLKVEKTVAICTSRDPATSDPEQQACKLIRRAPGFTDLLEGHKLRWAHHWDRCDLQVADSEPSRQLILRLHVFHLLQTVSDNTIDRDVGVPSRGWHGEAYRGHILWDEIFILPFLNLRIPELTRELLMYRYRRLDEARHLAVEAGYRGAMYPWQSGSDGREESQEIHLNPDSGRWIPDDTHLQRHVNSAIAYNVWKYYQATGDLEFLRYCGAELILEIARFWASIAEYNEERGRYEIRGVVGPDEFHTRYPGSPEPGLRNNTYTNVMAVWVLDCARRVLDRVGKRRSRELREKLGLEDRELEMWDEVSRRMYVPFLSDRIPSQFEGYENLEELDWKSLQQKHGDIQRLDRILEAEDDSPDRYKASKQADVLMLFFLFSSEELADLFQQMGYEWDPESIPDCVDYYIHRTSHGSTLSRVVHAWVLSRSDRAGSWDLFSEALKSDVGDIQGGTTSEGIHLGAMAGTVDLIQRCYTGIVLRDDVLWLNPRLPRELRHLRLHLRHRGDWFCVDINQEKLCVSLDEGAENARTVGYQGMVHTIEPGKPEIFPLHPEEPGKQSPGRK